MANKYWQKRTEARLVASERMTLPVQKRLLTIYKQAEENVAKITDKFINKYATAGKIPKEELKKLLTGVDKNKFVEDIQKKIANLGYKTDDIFQPGYLHSISRLDALKQQIYWEMAQVAPQESSITGNTYASLVSSSYNQMQSDLYDVGVANSLHTINRATVDRMVRDKWADRNYKKSVWGNVTGRGKALSETIASNLLIGTAPEKIQRQIRDQFDVSRSSALRLIRTESNYYFNQAEAKAAEDEGVDRYEFYAIMDGRTSQICREHDGRVYQRKDIKVGENYPPLHPNCRSTPMWLLIGEAHYDRIRPLKQTRLNADGTERKAETDYALKDTDNTAQQVVRDYPLQQQDIVAKENEYADTQVPVQDYGGKLQIKVEPSKGNGENAKFYRAYWNGKDIGGLDYEKEYVKMFLLNQDAQGKGISSEIIRNVFEDNPTDQELGLEVGNDTLQYWQHLGAKVPDWEPKITDNEDQSFMAILSRKDFFDYYNKKFAALVEKAKPTVKLTEVKQTPQQYLDDIKTKVTIKNLSAAELREKYRYQMPQGQSVAESSIKGVFHRNTNTIEMNSDLKLNDYNQYLWHEMGHYVWRNELTADQRNAFSELYDLDPKDSYGDAQAENFANVFKNWPLAKDGSILRKGTNGKAMTLLDDALLKPVKQKSDFSEFNDRWLKSAAVQSHDKYNDMFNKISKLPQKQFIDQFDDFLETVPADHPMRNGFINTAKFIGWQPVTK